MLIINICFSLYTNMQILRNSHDNQFLYFNSKYKINTDFLTTDPSKWDNDKHFTKSTGIVTNINVVNDVPERGNNLIEKYNTKITYDETHKQYFLQVVCDFCNKYPDSKKCTN